MAKSKRQTSSERRAVVEQLRREQAAKERRRNIIGTLVLALILAGLVVGVVIGTRGDDGEPALSKDEIIPSFPTGETTEQKQPDEVDNPTDIDGVLAWDTAGYPGPGKAGEGTLEHEHIQGKVEYAVIPPVGGKHNGVWMNAGIYTKPVPNERAVHNLEHGAIWITYDPSLGKKKVDELVELVEDQSMISESGGQANRFMILSPWADDSLPSPIVASSWGYQLRVDDPGDDRLQEFIDTFRHNETYTPEYGAAADGIPVETGGIPAAGGSKLANPSGKVDGQGM